MQVNGKRVSLESPVSLSFFLTEKGYRLPTIVVERNGQIITRQQFSKTMLDDGDTLEIVRFVGGG